jgi:hypothetical protein
MPALNMHFDPATWVSFVEKLNINATSLFGTAATFIVTRKPYTLPVPVESDIMKMSKDADIAKKLLIYQLAEYMKEMTKLKETNIKLITFIQQEVGKPIIDRCKSCPEYKLIIANNDPHLLFELVCDVYVYEKDRENPSTLYNKLMSRWASIKQDSSQSIETYVEILNTLATTLRRAELTYKLSTGQITEEQSKDDKLFIKSESEITNKLFHSLSRQDFKAEHMNRNLSGQPFDTTAELVAALNVYKSVSRDKTKSVTAAYSMKSTPEKKSKKSAKTKNRSKNDQDAETSEEKKTASKEKKKNKPDKANITCFKCNELGHYASECQKININTVHIEAGANGQNADLENFFSCYTTKVKDLDLNENKNIDIHEDYVISDKIFEFNNNIYIYNLYKNKNSEMYKNDEDILPVVPINVKEYNKIKNRFWYIDSFANCHFSGNKELILRTRQFKHTVVGVNGTSHGTICGDLSILGKVILARESAHNGLSLELLEKNCLEVTYISRVKYEVKVNEDIILDFMHIPGVGYGMEIDGELITELEKIRIQKSHNQIVANPTTVQQRASFFNRKELSKIEEVKNAIESLSFPSITTLKKIVRNNAIQDLNFDLNDINNFEHMYGDHISNVKGKAERGSPTKAKIVRIERPTGEKQIVYIDVFHMMKNIFLVGISKPLSLLMSRHIKDQSAVTITTAAKGFIKLLKDHDLECEIVCDGEKAFTSEHFSASVGVKVTITPPGDHNYHVEIHGKLLKRAVRATISSCPFVVSTRFAESIVSFCTSNLNKIPSGDLNLTSPYSMLTGKAVLYDKTTAPWGSYVQVTNTTIDNTMAVRTYGAIMIGKHNSERLAIQVFGLESKQITYTNKFKLMPMTEGVIERLNTIAQEDQGKCCIESTPERPVTNIPLYKMNRRHNIDVNSNNTNDLSENSLPNDADEDDIDDGDNVTRSNETQLVVGEGDDTKQKPDTFDDDHDKTISETDRTECNNTIDDIMNIIDDEDEYKHMPHLIDDDDISDDPGEGDAPIVTPTSQSSTMTTSKNISRYGRVCKPTWKTANAALFEEPHEAELLKDVIAYRLTVKKAIDELGDSAETAIINELLQLIDKNIWEYQSTDNYVKKSTAISSLMFLKAKYDALGTFIKVKGRLVGGGHQQDRELYGDLSSPTVALESLFIILGIAAKEDMEFITVDITGAYLECELPNNDNVHMWIAKDVVPFLIKVDPEAKKYINKDGKIMVKLKKALYGTVQASKLWYDKLTSVLEKFKYEQHPEDKCVYVKYSSSGTVLIAFHVDDLFIVHTCLDMANELLLHLRNSFSDITVNKGEKQSYLGMIVEKKKDMFTLSMEKYEEKLTEIVITDKRVTSPANDNLFDIPDSPKLSKQEAELFHTLVAKLLFLAKRTRIEILLCISHLAGRVSEPTVDDKMKLERVVKFLKNNPGRKLIFRKMSKLSLECYADASWAVHNDYTGRSGIIVLLNGCAVGSWTSKQKIVTRNSTESELVALTDATTHVIWYRNWLKWYLRCDKLDPTPMYQDNQSVISLQETGPKSIHRTKHLGVRYFWAKEKVKDGDITILYCATENMIADIHTKPKHGKVFRILWDRATGNDFMLTNADHNCDSK